MPAGMPPLGAPPSLPSGSEPGVRKCLLSWLRELWPPLSGCLPCTPPVPSQMLLREGRVLEANGRGPRVLEERAAAVRTVGCVGLPLTFPCWCMRPSARSQTAPVHTPCFSLEENSYSASKPTLAAAPGCLFLKQRPLPCCTLPAAPTGAHSWPRVFAASLLKKLCFLLPEGWPRGQGPFLSSPRIVAVPTSASSVDP